MSLTQALGFCLGVIRSGSLPGNGPPQNDRFEMRYPEQFFHCVEVRDYLRLFQSEREQFQHGHLLPQHVRLLPQYPWLPHFGGRQPLPSDERPQDDLDVLR